MLLRPVALDDSIVGQPLPWNLYNAAGRLLAACGMVVASREHLLRLTTQGLFRESDEISEADNPAQRLAALAQTLPLLLAEPHTTQLGPSLRTVAATPQQ